MNNTSTLWDHPDPFVIEITVKPEWIDALGHTNNLYYLDWLQRCAWQHSKHRGFGEQQMVELGKAMAVRETHMRYLRATFAGDQLLVGDWMTACDAKLRATRNFQILRPADRSVIMRAQIDYVCINIESGKPTRMTAEFIRAYADDVRDR
ncbi:MAG: acyl-CoA thioesterase [Pseudomonadales bacterium]